MLIGSKFRNEKSFKQKFCNDGILYKTPQLQYPISRMRMISRSDFASRPYPHTWMLLETQPIEFLLNLFMKPSADWWSEIEVIIKYERRSFLWNNEHINIYSRDRDEWENLDTDMWDLSKVFEYDTMQRISKWYK